jgi:hypothetical protein
MHQLSPHGVAGREFSLDRAPPEVAETDDRLAGGLCIDNVPGRLADVGELWKPLLAARGRVRLEKFFGTRS